MQKEISIEELAEVIRDSKKERVYKRDAHRGNRRLGTLEEELDKIDRGRNASEKLASRFVRTRRPS